MSMATTALPSTMNSSVKRPPPPQKPGKVKVVRALYEYQARNPDELSFGEGELLYVYEQHDKNWWKAKCGNKVGLIPSNYVEEQTEEIELPLHEAARRGNLCFLEECLKQGVSGTSLDSAGNTPLYWAARAGHLNCVERLINLPNNAINAQNKMGDTPMHIAASHSRLEVVEALLKAGAKTTLKNNDGYIPVDLTSDNSIKNIIQLNGGLNLNHGYKDDDYEDESD